MSLQKHGPFPAAFALIVLLSAQTLSCNGPEQPAQPLADSTGTQQPIAGQPVSTLPFSDPTFTDNKDTIASHGPRNITRSIMEDKKGNIWFASWEGIICYDGKVFTNFTNKYGLRRFHIFSMLEDSRGQLWFGTIGAGLYRYDGQSFQNFTTRDGLVHDRVNCITEDVSGNIWLGTGGGVSSFNGSTFRNYTTANGVIHNDVYAIFSDHDGKLWFGSRGEICFLEGESFVKFKGTDGRPVLDVRSIAEDPNGTLWFGGTDGLIRCDGASTTSFTKNFVGTVIMDKKGNLWTSSADPGSQKMALLCYDKKNLTQPATAPRVVRKEVQVFGLLEDSKGNIWFGTEKGAGRYDGKSFELFTS